MVNQKKLNQVKILTDLLKQSPNFVLISFNKTPHQTLEELRKKLSPYKAKLKVIKNTLFEKAVNKLLPTYSFFVEFKKKFLPLKNPSALLTFTNDWSKGLKVLYDFIQQEKTLIFKSGIIDGQIYNNDQLLAIAQLPSRDQLLGNIIGSLKNPMQRFIFVAKLNAYKLIYILKNTTKR
ncbi:MAG: 50S ribosomal protein L10 [Microgenomates group bacterium]